MVYMPLFGIKIFGQIRITISTVRYENKFPRCLGNLQKRNFLQKNDEK